MSRKIADRPYMAYQGERVAGMSPNEREAYMAARYGGAQGQQDLATSRAYAEQAATPFTEYDMDAYMNPYVKGALDPAAREIREEMAREQRELGSRATEMSAFGGARQGILEAEQKKGGREAISDLYGRGYAQAFESGRDQINRDRASSRAAADQFRSIGATGQAMLGQDIQNLLTTGGLERNLKQAGLDFDFAQFMEARDWDVTNLQPLLATLSSVPYGETTTNVTKSKKSTLSTIAGIGMTAVGAFTMNPMLMGAGLSSLASDGGGGGTDMSGMPTSFGSYQGIPGQGGGGGGGAYAPAFSNDSGSIGAMTWGANGPQFASGGGWDYSGGVY